MANHRGLVITQVIAVVVGAVLVGVMALTATGDTDESLKDEFVRFNVTFDEDNDNLSLHVSAETALREPGVYRVGYGTETIFIDPGFP